MKTLRDAAIVVAVIVYVIISAGGVVGSIPSSPVLGIGGGCTTKSGTLKGVGTGFDKSTLYVTRVKKPDSDTYPTTDYYAYGSTDEFGVMTLEWPCKGDAEGKYAVTVSEVKHPDRSASASFRISKS